VVLGLVANSFVSGPFGDRSTLAPVEGAPPAAQASALISEPATIEFGLETALQGRSGDATAAGALDAILSRWGYEPLGREELAPEQFSSAITPATGMLVLDTRTDLEQLIRLNLPAILELEPTPGVLRYVALLGLNPDGSVILEDGLNSFTIWPERLEQLWTRRTLVVWSNFESVPALRVGMTGRAVEWLQERLIGLDYLKVNDLSGKFDDPTREAVRQLQAEHALDPSGEVGPATLIAIYQALRYGAPALELSHAGGSLS
jgi:hypothetical protein